MSSHTQLDASAVSVSVGNQEKKTKYFLLFTDQKERGMAGTLLIGHLDYQSGKVLRIKTNGRRTKMSSASSCYKIVGRIDKMPACSASHVPQCQVKMPGWPPNVAF